MPRNYRLGRRQESAERTRVAILAAARDLLLTPGGRPISAAGVAERAGVSRLTIYNRFGSMAGLLREVAESAQRRLPSGPSAPPADARHELRERIADSCSMWSADPALFRRLPAMDGLDLEAAAADRGLAERLLASDQLRPGCSLKEAEDVLGAITSFAVFDRLHRDGRRSPSAVTEILMRMASSLLGGSAPASQGWPGSPRP